MKKALALILAFAVTTATFAQFEGSKQVFTSPKLQTEIFKHKKVAILPFTATISYKRLPKNFDQTANDNDQKNMAAEMQQGMYTYLLRKAENYSVNFQDVELIRGFLRVVD